MVRVWRTSALAAAFNAILMVQAAHGQTVFVRNVPGGSQVEVLINGATAATATADGAGDAELPINLAAHATKTEIDASIAVDICAASHRVVLADRGAQMAPVPAGCTRREIEGIFLVRRATNLVVTVQDPAPRVLLIQGSYSLTPTGPGAFSSPAPPGLVLSGGAGLAKVRDAVAIACGDVATCEGSSAWGAWSAAVTYWLSPFLAADATYVKNRKLEATGSGDQFRFTTALDLHVVMIGGKVGIPAGPARIYGQVGANYHRALFQTSQTIDERTVTIGGETQTIPGGTQRFELETAGWSWGFGGGFELWATRSFGLYAEFARARLKGEALEDEEGIMDDAVTTLLAGVRIRLF